MSHRPPYSSSQGSKLKINQNIDKPFKCENSGTAVAVLGERFTPGMIVLFGGDHAQVNSVTPDTIRVLTPDHKAGFVDVVVIQPDGTRASLPSAYLYSTS